MKKSFKLFHDSLDVLDELSDEEAGQLFKAIRAYEVGDKLLLSGLMKAIFTPFKNNTDRAKLAYTATVEANKANGLKGGRPKRNKANGLKPNRNNPDKDKDKDKDKIREVKLFTFNLDKKYSFDFLSQEYADKLKDYILKSEYTMSYEDFSNACLSNGYKYKNFSLAYLNWAKKDYNNTPKQTEQVGGVTW